MNPKIDEQLYEITYSVSNNDIIAVDENGSVFAKNRGTAILTCIVTDKAGNSVSDTCTVTVKYTWWQWILVILLFGWIWY